MKQRWLSRASFTMCHTVWNSEKKDGSNMAECPPRSPDLSSRSRDRVEDICYGIAIHVDDKADFEGERTAFAMSVGDADNIDRFDVYRIHESLTHEGFLEKTFEEKLEYVEKRLARLRELIELPNATKAAEKMWRSRLEFYISFYEKLLDQLNSSKAITD